MARPSAISQPIARRSLSQIGFEMDYFNEYCHRQGLKKSRARNRVVECFLNTEEHITAQELFDKMRAQGDDISYTTVYRALKVLANSGLAREIKFETNESHFEHLLRHRHHDHLFCIKCGRTIEFISPRIEDLQNNIAQRNEFQPHTHSLIIYGICKTCRNKIQNSK